MVGTLPFGTRTAAPSSSRSMRTSSSFWPALSFASMPVIWQTPWFGYTTRSPGSSSPASRMMPSTAGSCSFGSSCRAGGPFTRSPLPRALGGGNDFPGAAGGFTVAARMDQPSAPEARAAASHVEPADVAEGPGRLGRRAAQHAVDGMAAARGGHGSHDREERDGAARDE